LLLLLAVAAFPLLPLVLSPPRPLVASKWPLGQSGGRRKGDGGATTKTPSHWRITSRKSKSALFPGHWRFANKSRKR
jgi:hypothetical protein